MGRSLNTLKGSDVTVTPIKLKYSNTIPSASLGSSNITLTVASNQSFDYNNPSYGDNFLLYRSVQGMYYKNYITGSLLGSASAYEWYPQSTAASGTFDNDFRYFPTASDAQVLVISIPRAKYGENVARASFSISSSTYNIVDDGNGNLVDAAASNVHVGNLLYNQGIGIVTNQDYLSAFIYTPPPTASRVPLRTGLIGEFYSDLGLVTSSNDITRWYDQSGYGNNLNTVAPVNNLWYPQYSASYFNSLPAVYFSGSNTTGSSMRTAVTMSGLSGSQQLTIYYVARPVLGSGVIMEYASGSVTGSTGANWTTSTGSFIVVNDYGTVYMQSKGNVGDISAVKSIIGGTKEVYTNTIDFTLSTDEATVYENNSSTGVIRLANSNNSGSFEGYRLTVGGGASDYRWTAANALIGSILIYNVAHNNSERLQVYNYLTASYL
jgi:hypothetical protein